ncbi:MAG: hypothetical protein L6Q97_00410 [Thermoanaerobaculia bacterium]|nr:hypothetical protein [Thermoanaerobaculia bacterium]
MSAVEVKGNFLNFLAEIEDAALLRRMLEACLEIARTEHALDEMPPEILADLKDAIQRSYNEENLIPHESILKEREAWLKTLRG